MANVFYKFAAYAAYVAYVLNHIEPFFDGYVCFIQFFCCNNFKVEFHGTTLKRSVELLVRVSIQSLVLKKVLL